MNLGNNPLLLSLLITAQDQTGSATRSAKDNLQSIGTVAQNVANLVKAYLTFRVVVDGVEGFVALADKSTQLNTKLRLTTDSQAAFNAAQKALFDIAQDTGSELESVVTLYSRTDKAVKALGKTEEDALTLNRLLTESYKISGATTAEASQSLRQLIQGFESGVLRGDEFNSVMEESPRLAQALADGLGIPRGQLRGLAEDGKLTADVVINKLLGQAGKISAEYAQVGPTVEKSITQMRNALLLYVGEVNSAHGITEKLAGGISYLSQHVDDLAHVAEAAGLIVATRWTIGMAAATAASLQNAKASMEKAEADKVAERAVQSLLAVQAQATVISAKISVALVAEARERIIAAEAAERHRLAQLASAQALAQSARAIMEETAAMQASVVAARERLAAAKTIQSVTAAEAELTAAIEAQARAQWTTAAAEKNYAKALAEEKRLQEAATIATSERTVAESALNAALARNRAASGQAATASGIAAVATAGAGEKASLTARAMNALNYAFLLPLAYEAGHMLGDWMAPQFESVRLAGVALAQGVTELGVVWDVFTGKLTAAQGKEELKKIAQGYGEVADAATNAGQKAIAGQQAATEQVKQAQIAQREALDKSSEKLKVATKILEDEYTRQNAAVEQALAARLAKIAASGQAENIQAQLTQQAERQALAARLAALDEYGKRRLDAITAALGTQAEIEKQGDIMRKATEQASLAARIDAYQDLAKGYAAVVDQLQGQWQREMVLYNQGTESLKALERDHEATILEVRRSGMDERDKLRSYEREADSKVAALRAEQAKGANASQTELNRLYGDAEKAILQATTAKQSQARTIYEKNIEAGRAESELNKIWGSQKEVLEKINGQHKENAGLLLPSLEKAKLKLEEVNGQLAGLDKQLAKSKELKINLDQASVAAAQSTILDLTAPAEKIITIRTVVADAAAAAGASYNPAPEPVEGKRWGGLIMGLAKGGKLPGYGGGDRRLILAEDGEMVVNKESTANNMALLHAINQQGAVRKFAGGGIVESAFERAFSNRLEDKLTALANIGFAATSGEGGLSDWQEMDQILRDIHTAVGRAPASIRGKLEATAADKLQALLAQSQMSLFASVENAQDPLSVLQNSPGLTGRLDDKVRYLQRAISRLGGKDLSAAALGGFQPYDAAAQRDMAHVTPNFRLPDVASILNNAMAPVRAAQASMAPPAASASSMTTQGTQTQLVRHVFDFGSGKEVLFDVSAQTSDAFTKGLADLVEMKRHSA